MEKRRGRDVDIPRRSVAGRDVDVPRRSVAGRDVGLPRDKRRQVRIVRPGAETLTALREVMDDAEIPAIYGGKNADPASSEDERRLADVIAKRAAAATPANGGAVRRQLTP